MIQQAIVFILLTTTIFAQTPTLPPSTPTTTTTSIPPPSGNLAMDTVVTDQAKIGNSNPSSGSFFSEILGSNTAKSAGSLAFTDANGYWNYTMKFNGGCCNNCNKICGFAIKSYGSNYYLTNVGTFFVFQTAVSPNANQIFTLNQNSDCTWSLSNGGNFVSAISTYQGYWVGVSKGLGANQRWYIQRNNAYVEIQSAANQYYYWRASAAYPYYLGVSYGYSTRFTLEYYPCDKNYGWNW